MITSWDYFNRRQRSLFTRRQRLSRDGLPFGTAARRPGAGRLKDIPAHTFVTAVLQRMSGVVPSRHERMPVVTILFAHANRLINEEGVHASPSFRTRADIVNEKYIS